MSIYLSSRLRTLTPYVPGEQPVIPGLIKLNTNENPFAPSEKALEEARRSARPFNLYSDPDSGELNRSIASLLGLKENNIISTNGSDEILNFCFMAFCDDDHPAIFPDITYGFYKVFAQINGVPYKKIPLKDDWSIDPDDYIGSGGTVFIANPNAPTGRVLELEDIKRIIEGNKGNMVIIDEAYIDFGGESAVSLIDTYDNLIVTRTFSKSRSMAGARLGFGAANENIINDLDTVRFSTNPYNVNSFTQALGIAVLNDEEYTRSNISKIIETRDRTVKELRKLGFTAPDSYTNFIFAGHPLIDGAVIYEKLREKGILVRHFGTERIKNFNRISVGTDDQMDILLNELAKILAEEKR